MELTISVDHGNFQMKTPNRIFPSGLYTSVSYPSFCEEVLEYRGTYYAPSQNRIAYMRDKTQDKRFFLLTLFAIAYEILDANLYSEEEIYDITLLVGLPPRHYRSIHEKFEEYFYARDEADPNGCFSYTFQGKSFSICIREVRSYPQAFAAAATKIAAITNYPTAAVIDIGGYTVDYLPLTQGVPDVLSCSSLDNGIIHLYNKVIDQIDAELDLPYKEQAIDLMIQQQTAHMDPEAVKIANRLTVEFVADMLDKLRELGVLVKSSKAVFTGGGALRLRRYIEQSELVREPLFIEDIRANAKGYALLYQQAGS